MKKTFREIDHSGDIGIEVWGRDLGGLIENATRGLRSLLCRNEPGRGTARAIRVESASAEDLLVDWFSEVISMTGAYGEVYGEVGLERVGEWFAEGVIHGETIDPERHDLRFDVKAATYHGLVVRWEEDGYFGRVIFDL